MSLSPHLAATSQRHDLGDEGPHPVDRHVGLRIRMRRKEMGVTQEALADALGLTFQQIQKYERAANRVSASKLWEIAQALNAPIAYFYEGLGEASHDTGGTGDARTQEFLLTPEGLELAGAFPRIARGRLRRKVLELVRVLADPDPSTHGDEDVTLSS
ncbi:helix-turn-helix domain-containing protein [Phenylobacterium deserti]|uniref:Transcriptional regulator n=1 Tax=Phenylobacterium deserti TaxID=1914756 RepID=A0A328ACZ2_9CAUL|nr:helix-turn-helix domain-containing protein [Phenylobacterium deserti]RAK52539.1 transcriptional regulator [Phenylobacterium deserti]